MANQIVVGVLEAPDSERRLMQCRTKDGDPETGHWEHPSATIDAGETPSEALGRMLRETLGIEVVETEHLGAGQTWDPLRKERVWMDVYRCRRWRGALSPQAGQRMRWMTKSEVMEGPCSEGAMTVETLAKPVKKGKGRETIPPWITLMAFAIIAAAFATSLGTTGPSRLDPVQAHAAGCPIPSSSAWAPIQHAIGLANAVANGGHCLLIALEVLRHHLTIALALGASAASLWGLAGGLRRARWALPLSCVLIMLSGTTAWLPWS